ncbi:MAG: DMT family transporter, partial [Planctomycetota bacterium]
PRLPPRLARTTSAAAPEAMRTTVNDQASIAPLLDTRDNFVRALPLALGALGAALVFTSLHASARGLALAAASGAAASGVGYSLWYLALPRLTAVRAALLQLLVPVLAATLGILLLDEHLTWRLAVAGPLVLAGVGWAVLGRRS